MSQTTQAFCDTCVLLNYLNQEWERDKTTAFFEAERLEQVISETVESEFENVVDRRLDLYEDFVEFINRGGEVAEYTPDRGYLNDQRHVREIQEAVLTADDTETTPQAAKRLRRFSRRFEQKADAIVAQEIAEVVFTSPPLSLTFSLRDIIDNENDCDVVADGADWAAQGGSGLFITLDGEDILELADKINDVICEEFDEEGTLHITPPDADLPPGSL